MSRRRKTPPELARVITERHPAVVEHAEEMIRVKRTVPVENQADHVRDRSEAEMTAFVRGYSACLEAVMHEFNCYAGFQNYGPMQRKDGVTARQGVRQGDPEYLDWRVLYYTNGITKG